MTRCALITGIGGQDGVLLARLLVKAGHRVVGLTRDDTAARTAIDAYLHGIEIVTADIRDSKTFGALLERVAPDEVYNLAGFSSVGASWEHPEVVAEINAMAVVGMLEQLRRYRDRTGREPRFYQASSSEMFGLAATQPQRIDTPHHPRSPYAASKSFAHNITVNYRESYGMYACSGILYNHESPLRPPQFVTRKVTRAVAEIREGKRTTLSLGNTDVRRDWGAAADYVDAMHRMLQQPEPSDYIIASGVSRPLSDWRER